MAAEWRDSPRKGACFKMIYDLINCFIVSFLVWSDLKHGKTVAHILYCGSVVVHCVSSAKGCRFNSQGTHILTKKCITWMQCKSVWIKAKCINVNVNIMLTITLCTVHISLCTCKNQKILWSFGRKCFEDVLNTLHAALFHTVNIQYIITRGFKSQHGPYVYHKC